MNKLYPYLTYSGATPFILCAFFMIFDIKQLPVLGSLEKILSVYALVISTFLAGSHWGQHFHIQGKWSHILPILSNIIAIVLWLGFLILSFQALMTMFVTVFIVFLIIDQRLFHNNLITRQYFQTRCFVSTTVILTLIISVIVS